MDHMELPHRHGNNEELSRLEHCMQEAESFQAVAGLCRLLSDANRVRIFWLLCHCEECVVNLAALVGMSSPAASTICGS
ncbi:MAG: ArsR/SmtB family transcription factor [Oscillospiraceae bacterium]